jgi:pimeloyl-ACP methyl ester carboxylesterase
LLAGYALAVVLLGLEFGPVRPRSVTDADAMAEVLGSRIAYRSKAGVGPTLILLHGFGGSLVEWEQMASRLNCGRVISVDALGFGASSRPPSAYDLEDHRKHIVGLMDALGISSAIVVGHSFGASLALWTAAHTPDRITAAIAMAPSGLPGELRAQWPRSFLFKPGLPNSIASALARSPLFRWLYADSQARQALGISGSYGAKFEAAMPLIKQPTLLLWSPGDMTAPYPYGAQYLKLIPQAQLITFAESSGHGISQHEPDRAVKTICEFVAALGH